MSRRLAFPFVAAGLAALGAACARQGAPPGGPADRRPPVIVQVRPDTFARIEAGDHTIRIQFDETLSESPSSGTLDQAVQVSPRTGEVEVSHKGDAIEVKIEGGFRPGAVYRVTVLPVLEDRFSNTLLDPFEWVFSTGPEFQANALAGEVWDRITGEPVPALDVFAISSDSVRYVARTDTAGVFVMRYLPLGPYTLASFDDRNRNGTADPFELQGVGDPAVLGPADTLLTSFWVMVPDTTPPALARAEKVDSTTLRLVFDDPLEPEQPLDGLVRAMYRDSGDTPGVIRALHPWQYDIFADSVAEVRAAEQAAAAAAEPDSAAPSDSVPAAPQRPAPPEEEEQEEPRLPDGRRVPSTDVVLLLRAPIEGGDLYTVLFRGLVNISGLAQEEAEGQFRLPADPLPAAADSAAADTAGVAPPDTASVPPPPPDTMRTGRR